MTRPDGTITAYPAGHPAALLILALAPDLLAGWTRPPSAESLTLLPPVTHGLPRVPRLTGDGDVPAMADAVRAVGAGLIVDVGGSAAAVPATVAQAAGAAFLSLDGRLAGTPESLRRLGRALGRMARADMLATEVERWLDRTAQVGRGRLRLYYGCGPDALEVPTEGTLAREVFLHLGLDVMTADAPSALARVDIADVADFDPDWIVCLDGEGAEAVRTRPDWRRVRAAASGRVLTSPARPFLWLDRPPGINRILGLLWLADAIGLVEVGEAEIGRWRRLLCGW